MDQNAAEDQFYELAARFFGRQRDSLGEHTRLRRDLKADSLDRLAFILETESCFQCRLSDEGLAWAKTLGDLWQVASMALGFRPEPFSAKNEF